jgi:hypothetical protein
VHGANSIDVKNEKNYLSPRLNREAQKLYGSVYRGRKKLNRWMRPHFLRKPDIHPIVQLKVS